MERDGHAGATGAFHRLGQQPLQPSNLTVERGHLSLVDLVLDLDAEMQLLRLVCHEATRLALQTETQALYDGVVFSCNSNVIFIVVVFANIIKKKYSASRPLKGYFTCRLFLNYQRFRKDSHC